jgi:hypothetical protein
MGVRNLAPPFLDVDTSGPRCRDYQKPRGDSRPRLSSRATLDNVPADAANLRSAAPPDSRGQLAPRGSW